jgi:hypothetical protein
MYRTSQGPSRERCAEHDLAVGPGGVCILCRRATVRPAGRQRWLAPTLVAAGLGTLLLGGVALARGPGRPIPETAPVEAMQAQPRLEAPAVHVAATETRPCEPQPVRASAPPPAAPQRNYLDEAYAAMPKEGLYDEGPAHLASGGAACPCRAKSGCQPHGYTYTRGVPYYTRTGVSRVGAPGTQMGAPPPPQVAAGPRTSLARSFGGRR